MPIIVNKIEISDDEVHSEMQYHPAATVEEARHKAAQALVIRQLLLQEAKKKDILESLGVYSADTEEKAIDELLKQEVSVPEIDDEICMRYYEHNQKRFVDKKTGKVLPLNMVASYIRDYLYTRSLQTGINQYTNVLAEKAEIAGFEL